jgi:hypothetical protein
VSPNAQIGERDLRHLERITAMREEQAAARQTTGCGCLRCVRRRRHENEGNG